MRQTLNQIYAVLRQFAENHLQVNTFATGKFSEVAMNEQVKYPLMYVEVVNSTTSEKTVMINLNVLVADLEAHDSANREDVHSDTLQTALDLRTWLMRNQEFEEFTIEPNSTLQPFSMKFSDNISGWINSLSVVVSNANNICDIPVEGFDASVFSPDQTTIWNANLNFQAGPGLQVSRQGMTVTYSHTGSTAGSTPNELMLHAGDGFPSVSNGANAASVVELDSGVNIKAVGFPNGNISYFNWETILPENYTGGSISAKFYWSSPTSSTNSVVWGIQGRSFADGNSMSQPFVVGVSLADANNGEDVMNISTSTSSMVFDGSPAAGELICIRVYRDPTDPLDTLAATANLHAIKLSW